MKTTSATEVARDGYKDIKPLFSLPLASRLFYAARTKPTPYTLAQGRAATFPDIAAVILTDSNCLLPKGFIAKVNNRAAVSPTGTNPHTTAASYTTYLYALTCCLNQSFPIGDDPRLTFTKAPTAIQLAIHPIPTHVLAEDEEQILTFIKRSSYNAKEVTIGEARYRNTDRASGLSKQGTSVVVSVDPDDIPILLPALFLFSKCLKVEKTTQANLYTQCTNCYQFGHTSPRYTQKPPTWPYTVLHHTRSAHRWQNATCPNCGASKAIPTAVPPPPPTAPTVVTTTMPSTKNAGLDQFCLRNRRPPNLSTTNYPTPPPTVMMPWIWAMTPALDPLLPNLLQPRLSSSPPPDLPATPRSHMPSPAGPSQHPQARACHR